ncbi:OmpA family protein [Marinomonas balearica]|uniref:Outer membrane protein OmpA-like peptidoglycan-associated protein n=1 Tax=Marinomonas balearica TaxID=491947 RepID=A0A4V3CGX2_9GAMM|nr:OmpA family protein [Marinomonas balearica]TDO99382.1 outer membrane protein OmpA-like peptidoglycan-associated protein [Marinomonas balearica]
MSSNRDSQASQFDENQQMEQLRSLVLGEDCQIVRDVVEESARDLVTNVLTEALHDRQKNDGSVTAVIAPLVEQSVESSVVARKDQFVSYLYPLVGSLVRKSVSSFLAEIIEQTNELLESSLTYKGLKWRFEARRAGISYSQYVVQKTFVFRVEQVLLIHKETGMLLKTVIRDKTQATDGDMVSAMLTAINDFVADSFSPQENELEQSLDEIKTDDFILLIKQGPKAMLVAAITGNPPAGIADKLQLTLESIHQIYNDELNDYDGDSSEFENTEQQLNECLLAQQKENKAEKKKLPWLAIGLLLLGFVGLVTYFSKGWEREGIANDIRTLNAPPGIVLLSSKTCGDKVCVEVLRDPVAQDVSTWISSVSDMDDILLTERSYRSLDERLQPQRLKKVANTFAELQFDPESGVFLGSLSRERYDQFQSMISVILESKSVQVIMDAVKLDEHNVSNTIALNKLANKVRLLPDVPGIVLLSADVCAESVCVEVLRDPDAQKASTWIRDIGSEKRIKIRERHFQAVDERLLPSRLARIVKMYPELVFDSDSLHITGSISVARFQELRTQLLGIPESISVDFLLNDVSVESQSLSERMSDELQLEQYIYDIKATKIRFDVNENQLPDIEIENIKRLGIKLDEIQRLAKNVKQTLFVIIMGTSTSGGTEAYNNKLSLDRANAVMKALIDAGIPSSILRTTGLGVFDRNIDTPKVIFDVVRPLSEENREVQD